MNKFTAGLALLLLLGHFEISAQRNAYPKASPDANVLLDLSSNVEETTFYIDGKEIQTGERIKVLINKKEHTIEAIPKGYIKKKDYLQPPYIDKYATLRFTFLLEDKIIEPVVTAQPLSQSAQKIEVSGKTSSEGSLSSIPASLSSTAYEHRYALVIGNSAYSESPLRNPANDAKVIASELKALNFDVMAYVNVDKVKMKELIREFEAKVRENKGVALFYFAGHGLQYNGANYLVPINAKIVREYDIEDECLKADMVLRMLEITDNPMNIIILDACRNNPYSKSTRSMDRGLAQPDNAPKGSIIAFATAPGKTASDGDGDNGLYTQELIKALKRPGLSVEQVFKEVRINVIKLSNNSQTPWENSSLLGDFYFH
jgi:hypothetical protein